jgi:aryl sulfotransferase
MDGENKRIEWPKKTREYEDMDADSTRWNDFKFRDDDIVIDTLGKSGTTWMQQIVGQLIFKGEDALFADPISTEQWLDLRIRPIKEILDLLEAQTHRRCIKTHLPIDALVFSPNARYIYVGRDMRDIIWSWYSAISIPMREPANPPSLPLLPKVGVREFYLHVADYEPMWSHVKNWWAFRHLPNVLFVHFSNLKADLGREIRRIALFLDISLDEALLPKMIEHCSLDYMRDKLTAGSTPKNAGFASSFFVHKGANGRWKDVLSSEEIALADAAAAKYLTPECAHWLATGELPKGEN